MLAEKLIKFHVSTSLPRCFKAFFPVIRPEFKAKPEAKPEVPEPITTTLVSAGI